MIILNKRTTVYDYYYYRLPPRFVFLLKKIISEHTFRFIHFVSVLFAHYAVFVFYFLSTLISFQRNFIIFTLCLRKEFKIDWCFYTWTGGHIRVIVPDFRLLNKCDVWKIAIKMCFPNQIISIPETNRHSS